MPHSASLTRPLASVALAIAAGAACAQAPAPEETVASPLQTEVRNLKAGSEEFIVYVQPMTGGPAKGAVVLLPGDGQFPATSAALARLRVELPAFGWSTWLPVLDSPPLIHSLQLTDGAAQAAPGDKTEAAGTGAPAPAPAAATAPAAAAPAAPAAAATDAAQPAQPGPSLEEQRTKELREWAERSRARLAATVEAAASEGSVVVIAEGAAAVVLTGFAAEAPTGAHAVALIDPVELPGMLAVWPKGYATPVFEVMGPSMLRETGSARRTAANAAGLHYYRQSGLSDEATAAPGDESMVTRRLRGWLKSLEH